MNGRVLEAEGWVVACLLTCGEMGGFVTRQWNGDGT